VIPKALLCNNRSAFDLAETHRTSKLSVHIDLHYYYVRELVYDKTIKHMYIQTMDNLAHMYIKDLLEVQLPNLCSIALGYTQGGCWNENGF
jgi:hypothetical protein